MRVLSDLMSHLSANRINELELNGQALTPKMFIRHLLLIISRALVAWSPVPLESVSSSPPSFAVSDEAIRTLRTLVSFPSWGPSVRASIEFHVQRMLTIIGNYG